MDDHKTLGGVFRRDDFIVQALDKASHNGYEKWHRAYDDEVVRWIREYKEATPDQFLDFIMEIYKRTDMQKRFPDADKLLEMGLEEIK